MDQLQFNYSFWAYSLLCGPNCFIALQCLHINIVRKTRLFPLASEPTPISPLRVSVCILILLTHLISSNSSPVTTTQTTRQSNYSSYHGQVMILLEIAIREYYRTLTRPWPPPSRFWPPILKVYFSLLWLIERCYTKNYKMGLNLLEVSLIMVYWNIFSIDI